MADNTIVVTISDLPNVKARIKELEDSLEVLANIPIEDFDWGRHPERAIMGWNHYTLYVHHVMTARKLLGRPEFVKRNE